MLRVAIAGFVAGLIALGNGSQETADKISGSILSGAAVVGYIKLDYLNRILTALKCGLNDVLIFEDIGSK